MPAPYLHILNAIIPIQTTRLQKSLSFASLAAIDIISSFARRSHSHSNGLYGLGIWSLVGMMLSMNANQDNNVLLRDRMASLSGILPTGVSTVVQLRRLPVLRQPAADRVPVTCGNHHRQTLLGVTDGLLPPGRQTQLDIGLYPALEIIVQVMYPVHSRIQDNRPLLISTMLMNLRVIALSFSSAVHPDSCGRATDWILYGEVWLPAAPYFRILCVGGVFMCLTNINYYGVPP